LHQKGANLRHRILQRKDYSAVKNDVIARLHSNVCHLHSNSAYVVG
jgi:hypothetical protein